MLPKQVFVMPEALNYPNCHEILARLEEKQLSIELLKSNRMPKSISKDPQQMFLGAKRTLVLAVRKKSAFQSCRPSSDYQLPLVSGCPGLCHYCYLNTNFGPNPYVRVYVNIAEIFEWAEEYIIQRQPLTTMFEGSATSDPVPVEGWTQSLAKTIEYFANHPYGRFRFVTKFDTVDSLLKINHKNHTQVRFTLNTERVIKYWDTGTPGLDRRLAAAEKIALAGYPYGFLIGPIITYDNWQRDYRELIQIIAAKVPPTTVKQLSFELITHRFTPRAKKQILQVYPETDLDLDETQRVWKYGQFGYGKWVYPPATYATIQEVLVPEIHRYLPQATIMYLV